MADVVQKLNMESDSLQRTVTLEAYWRNFRPIPGSWWYRITISNGGTYSKEYVLGMLLASVAPASFIPLSYQVSGADASFFVDDAETAAMLANLDKLAIRVRPGSPHLELNFVVKHKIKAKHDSKSKALDLSRFHTDPDLMENCAVALFTPTIIMTVLDIMVENVPDLRALDLSYNNLSVLDSLVVLAVRFPELRILHIGRNLIRHMDQLHCLGGLHLEELVLQGNPLCEKYIRTRIYIDVKKMFPGLMKLDGVDIRPHKGTPNEVLPTALDRHINPAWPTITVPPTTDKNDNIYENSDKGNVRMGGPQMKRA